MSTPAAPSHARFAPTRWSLILAANADAPGARRALEDLLRIYWFPLYACLRRRGHAPHAAEDLTQGFLADLLARDDLAALSPAKGKFRSFLLAGLTHYVSNQRAHDRAQKRGGARAHLSLHAPPDAEARYSREPADTLTPAPTLTGDSPRPYAALAHDLGLTEAALKVAAHRLRKRYRDTLRAHIAATLPEPAPPAQVEEEITHLLNSL